MLLGDAVEALGPVSGMGLGIATRCPAVGFAWPNQATASRKPKARKTLRRHSPPDFSGAAVSPMAMADGQGGTGNLTPKLWYKKL